MCTGETPRSERQRLPPLTERPASPEESLRLLRCVVGLLNESSHTMPYDLQGRKSQPQSMLSTGVVARRRPGLRICARGSANDGEISRTLAQTGLAWLSLAVWNPLRSMLVFSSPGQEPLRLDPLRHTQGTLPTHCCLLLTTCPINVSQRRLPGLPWQARQGAIPAIHPGWLNSIRSFWFGLKVFQIKHIFLAHPKWQALIDANLLNKRKIFQKMLF